MPGRTRVSPPSRPTVWRTVAGGSRRYVEAIAAGLAQVRLSSPVRSVCRHPDGVTVRDDSGAESEFDAVVIATHPDQALRLLDEPTPGLDPQARHAVWDRLYRLKQQGVTLVLTTHYMDEAEQLCDRLMVMDRGMIAAEGSPRELIERYSTPEVLELRFDPAEHQQAADKLADVPAERLEALADRILLYAQNGDTALAAVRGLGLEPLTSLVRRSTLEDVFLRLTGRRLED